MAELEARRRARDLWISRSHLVAAAVGAVVLSAATFGLGLWLGRAGPPAVDARPALSVGEADDALLELLARVEANTAAEGGVEELSYPDALRGAAGGGEAVPPQGPAALAPPVTVPAAEVVPPVGDPAPPGAYTIVVARSGDHAQAVALRERLAAAGLSAWVGAELVDGVPVWRIAVGGHATENEAVEALPTVGAAGIGAPAVEPL